MTEWYRIGPSTGIQTDEDGKPHVDRKAGIIYGASIVTKGEALGHDEELDDVFLDQVLLGGGQSKTGIKSRFDHPMASSTSMGTFIGRAKGFRRDGDQVRADIHLADSAATAPQGDLRSYIMDLAEEDPQAFGVSIVFRPDDPVYRIDENGERKKGPDGKLLLPLVRLKALLAADVVDSPAANAGGLFGLADTPADKATAFLDRYFNSRGVDLSKLTAGLTSRQEDFAMAETVTAPPAEKAPPVDVDKIKAEALRAGEDAAELRLKALSAAFPDRPSFVIEQFSKGHDVQAAKAELADVLVKELSEKDKEISELKQKSTEATVTFCASDAGRTTGGGASGTADQEKAWRSEYDAMPESWRAACKFENFCAAKRSGDFIRNKAEDKD